MTCQRNICHNFFSNRQNDPLGNTANDINSVLGNYHNIGGNDYLAADFSQYMVRDDYGNGRAVSYGFLA